MRLTKGNENQFISMKRKKGIHTTMAGSGFVVTAAVEVAPGEKPRTNRVGNEDLYVLFAIP